MFPYIEDQLFGRRDKIEAYRWEAVRDLIRTVEPSTDADQRGSGGDGAGADDPSESLAVTDELGAAATHDDRGETTDDTFGEVDGGGAL